MVESDQIIEDSINEFEQATLAVPKAAVGHAIGMIAELFDTTHYDIIITALHKVKEDRIKYLAAIEKEANE